MKPKSSNLTYEEVTQILSYNPNTGDFIWCGKYSRGPITIGMKAGTEKDGYIYIKIKTQSYLAHRLAWFIVNKEWPKEFIDHKDGNSLNNKISNLRPCSHSQNIANSKPRRKKIPKGVYQNKSSKNYRAAITFKNRRIHIGTFKTQEEAHLAYCKKAKQLQKEFARFK